MDLDQTLNDDAVESLLEDVQNAFHSIVGCAETNGNTYIIQKSVIHDAMHAFTALMDAFDEGVLRDRITIAEPPPPSVRINCRAPQGH